MINIIQEHAYSKKAFLEKRKTFLVAIIPPTRFIFPHKGLDLAPFLSTKVVAGGIIGPIPYSTLSIKALFGCTRIITRCGENSSKPLYFCE